MIRMADIALAVVCFACSAIGVPVNAMCLQYFWRQTRNVTNIIYIAVSVLDLLTCIFVFPVGESMNVNIILSPLKKKSMRATLTVN